MFHSKICLSLTASTLKENLEILEKYRNWIDVAELRADYLSEDERLSIRRFPEMAKMPCILSIRRASNGGKFDAGEASRTVLFARGIAYADQDTRKNYAYIDLEEDFNVPSIQDAALAFGTRIIRSFFVKDDSAQNIERQLRHLRISGNEIPKIDYEPKSLPGLTALFEKAAGVKNLGERIFAIKGVYALPASILAAKLSSYMTYTLAREEIDSRGGLSEIDPIELVQDYNYRSIGAETQVFAITGNPLVFSLSPKIHNAGYREHGINGVFVPIRASSVEESLAFAEALDIRAMSISRPFKSEVLQLIPTVSEKAYATFTCDSIVRGEGGWAGYNACADAMVDALRRLTGRKNLFGCKVAIIGSGSEAGTAAYAVKQLRGKACVFSNPARRAKALAAPFGFRWASLTENSLDKLEAYSDLIIQTKTENPDVVLCGGADFVQDPLPFYEFSGGEFVFDCAHNPNGNPCLERARKAGCTAADAFEMFRQQAKKQFEIFTGIQYDRKNFDAK